MILHEFEVDLSRFPLVRVVYPSSPTVPQLEAVFQMYAEQCARGEPIGIVVDFRYFDPVRSPATARQAAAALFAKHAAAYRNGILCEARAVTSAISRGTITAFDWLTGTKWPCANFATVLEADAWVMKQLEKAAADRTARRSSVGAGIRPA